MPLRDEIYNRIKRSIIYGEVTQGKKLSEIGLGNTGGVNLTPIREAFRQL
jgi:DNA-binding GntR family transcriptional regulator